MWSSNPSYSDSSDSIEILTFVRCRFDLDGLHAYLRPCRHYFVQDQPSQFGLIPIETEATAR